MRKTIPFIFVISIMLLSSSCFHKKTGPAKSAEELYNESTAELNKKSSFPRLFSGTNFDKLFENLKEIQIRYTFSPYATLAEVRTGDAYFKQEEYSLAVSEYTEFIKLHPTHSEIEHATYYIAESYYLLRRGKDRDYGKPILAIEWFTKFIQQFPDSTERVEEAKKKIIECRNILAKREIYIGKFYQKRKNYEAAIKRYNNVLEKYPDTRYNNEALELLEEVKVKPEKQKSS
ncbi:MAG: outer membrane protein assembly factor BamD [Thermodesulfobacteriota bacterium]